MRTQKKIAAAVLVVASSLLLVSAPPASGSAGQTLLVVVNPAVPIAHLSSSEIESIYTSSRRSWPDGSSISAFSYSPEDDIRQEFDREILRMPPDEVARFWLDQRVRGGARPPRQVPDPALAVRLVAKLPGSIAYIPEKMVNSTVKVVARIKAGKVVEP
jgi:hypothetical protein